MACICTKCGRPMEECEFKICAWCHIDGADDTTKNMMEGGRFHGIRLPFSNKGEILNKSFSKEAI